MIEETSQQEGSAWQLSAQGDTVTITLTGHWCRDRAAKLPAAIDLCEALPDSARSVVVKLQAVKDGDSLLPALIYSLRKHLQLKDIELTLPELPPTTDSLLALTEHALEHTREEPKKLSWLERLGTATLKQWSNVLVIAGSLFFFLRSLVRTLTGHKQFRWGDFLTALNQCTIRALPIITIVSLLLGSILAFVGAIQLEAFGASVYIADTVGIAVAREMAAIMTAIVLAGHTGAAFAAQLASMRVNEEVDALRTIGLSPHDYLAVPRVFALTLAMPMLYLYAAVVTLLGSLLVANVMLGLSPTAYMVRTINAVPMSFFILGLVKSLCFGALIGLVSCHIGLHSGRSAEAVGDSATQAVVMSILGIILIDSLFAIASILFGF